VSVPKASQIIEHVDPTKVAKEVADLKVLDEVANNKIMKIKSM